VVGKEQVLKKSHELERGGRSSGWIIRRVLDVGGGGGVGGGGVGM